MHEPCTQVDGGEIIKRADGAEATQALASVRKMLSVFPSAGSVGGIDRVLQVCSAAELQAVSKHTRWGQAPSLQNLFEHKSHHVRHDGVCLLSDTGMCFLSESQARLPISSPAAAAGDHTYLAGSSLSRGGSIIPAGNWSMFRRPPGLLVTPSSLRGLASKILKVVS